MSGFLKRYVPLGSFVLVVTTFGSYGMGLLRDRIFAQSFGLSVDLDAYNAAFLLPDFLFNLLVASGIAAAVVPLYSQLKRKSLKESAEYINSVISAALLTMALVSVGLIVFADQAANLAAPGLATEGKQLAANLIRILAISPLLFALSNSLGAMLVAEKRFIFYGLSPILYNFGIIGGVLIMAPRYGIMGAALGTIAGAGLHAGIRVYDAYRSGWRWRWQRQWQTPVFAKTIRLMVPKMAGHPVELVTFWAFTAMASHLAPGSISALNFARNFQSVPVSIVGISMATAAFPLLADAAARQRTKEYTAALWRICLAIFLISTAAGAALYLIRIPLISILLGGGSFDPQAVARTAGVLGVFCLAVPTEAVNQLLARAFYARQNTVIPVLFSVASLVAAISLAWILMPDYGLLALPIGFFAGSLVKTVGMLTVIRRLAHSL